MNVAETILVFVGIPLAIFLLLALLIFMPGGRKHTRYKPGQPWNHAPIWYEPHPEHGPADGHGETKATRLWLRNLPPLQPTNIVPERVQRVHNMAPGPDRWRERSRTYPGIAAAMAAQWSVADLSLGLTA